MICGCVHETSQAVGVSEGAYNVYTSCVPHSCVRVGAAVVHTVRCSHEPGVSRLLLSSLLFMPMCCVHDCALRVNCHCFIEAFAKPV